MQGVYFRHSTRLQAQGLRVRGFARNLADGSVEVLAHGPAGAVDTLHEWLRQGPAHARVEHVEELAPEPEVEAPAEFEIA